MAVLTKVLLRLFFTTGGLIVFLLCPASCLARPPHSSSNSNYYCDWCPRRSTASPDLDASLLRSCGTSRDGDDGGFGCGYGAAEQLDGGGAPHVAAAGADSFSAGAGCGACYQLRCRDRRVCGDGGVKVVVVAGLANRTGFVLTREAFAAMMARPRVSSNDQLLPGLGGNVVEVDFRRIPCEYKNRNLSVRIDEEGSRHPAHLAITFLYQGGQTDIAAVELSHAHAQPPSWRPMAPVRRRGIVTWRTSSAPAGLLQLRLVVTAGVGGKWLRAGGDVLPADWRPGQVHDTGLRVRDVALSSCARSCRGAATAGASEELR